MLSSGFAGRHPLIHPLAPSPYPNVAGAPRRLQWPGAELNCRHADFQSAALPTELPGLKKRLRPQAGCPSADRIRQFIEPKAVNYKGAPPSRKSLIRCILGGAAPRGGVNDINLNARGFNSSLNRRVLVLLDGRDLAITLLGRWRPSRSACSGSRAAIPACSRHRVPSESVGGHGTSCWNTCSPQSRISRAAFSWRVRLANLHPRPDPPWTTPSDS